MGIVIIAEFLRGGDRGVAVVDDDDDDAAACRRIASSSPQRWSVRSMRFLRWNFYDHFVHAQGHFCLNAM